MSILTQSLPQNRLKIDGITISKEQKLAQVIALFKQKPQRPSDIASQLQVARETVSREYIKPLLAANEIKKVAGTKFYQLVEQNQTHQDLLKELHSKSEIMNTNLMKNWNQNNHSKHENNKFVRFTKIVLGKVNPKFKIHPDSITKDNWESVIINARNAILEIPDKFGNKITKLCYHDRQTLRHAVMYGLDVTISEVKGQKLGIDGDKLEAISADLQISKKQISEAKEIMKKNPLEFCKFGFKTWTFARPSSIYIVKTNDLIFYDRTVKFVIKKNGEKISNKDTIEYIEETNPEKIQTYTHRACRLNLFEHKTQTDYKKFIYDEDFVKALEKYVAQRQFQKKKYLFWADNKTIFTFENYDKLVSLQVKNDNDFFKKILKQIGFKKEDFGIMFRANYAFRHFGIQMWLIATNFDYEKVSEMSHDDVSTLKKWYGKRSAEHFEKEISEVVF